MYVKEILKCNEYMYKITMKVLSNLMSIWFSDHMVLVWTFIFLTLKKKGKLTNMQREIGPVTTKEYLESVWKCFQEVAFEQFGLFLNFVSNWKLDFKILWVAEVLNFLHCFLHLTFIRNLKQLKYDVK